MFAASVQGEKSTRKRATSRVKKLFRPDGRSRLGRRVRELVGIFRQSLTDAGRDADSPIVKLLVEHAASNVALVEQARQEYVRGKINSHDLIRAERLAGQCVRALRLTDKPKPQAPDLRDYIASRSGASA